MLNILRYIINWYILRLNHIPQLITGLSDHLRGSVSIVKYIWLIYMHVPKLVNQLLLVSVQSICSLYRLSLTTSLIYSLL